MKKYKIAVQKGLNEIMDLLKKEGHEVVYYEEAGMDADITIVSGIDSEYEEIETTECRISGSNGERMLVIDATKISPEKVLEYIENITC